MKNLIKFATVLAIITIALSPIAYAENMPADVLSRVRADTAAEYPDNYAVQKLMIDTQKKSYKFLSTYAPAKVPPDVLKKIMSDAAAEYPDNFGVQKLMVETQVKSYLELTQ
jgi:hypothetical protein